MVDLDSNVTEPITKELREFALDMANHDAGMTYALECIADRIDAEHERRVDGAVPVVRCSECKWLRTFDGRCLCVRNRNATCLVDWDDYCSEGVRLFEAPSSYGGVPLMSEGAKRIFDRLMDLSGGGVSE